jgi:hypothetical protein
MGQVLHGSATTTHAIRAAIQRSKAPLKELAARHGLNRKTVAKWRKRSFLHDAAMGPKAPRSTVLTAEEEATNDRVALDGYSAVRSSDRAGPAPGGRWVTIWSRLPLLGPMVVRDRNRAAATRIASPIGELIIYGTVLPWQTDVGEPPIDPKPKGWSEQYRTIPLQAADWIRMQRERAEAHLVVAGDLNMSLGGPRYYGTREGRSLLAQAMEAAELFCATSFERVPTGTLQHPAIDHILLPAPWAGATRIASAWEGAVQNVRLSDHSGLVVEIAS